MGTIDIVRPTELAPFEVMFLVEPNGSNIRIFYRAEDTSETAELISTILKTDSANVRLVDWENDFLSTGFGFGRCFEIHPSLLQTNAWLQGIYFAQMLGKCGFFGVEATHKNLNSGANFLTYFRKNREYIESINIKLNGDDFFRLPHIIVKSKFPEGRSECVVLTFSGVEDKSIHDFKTFGTMLTMERRLKLQENDSVPAGKDNTFTIY